MYACVCVSVCVCFVRVRVCVYVCMRESMRERESVCVYVCVREKEFERAAADKRRDSGCTDKSTDSSGGHLAVCHLFNPSTAQPRESEEKTSTH